MPVVEIKLWKGRDREQKAEMAKGITEVISRVGKTAPENVHVVFTEVDQENWAIAGKLADEE